ncbi:hypothetical protein J5X84_36085 [Streptosporangiaceae bacterium NEAU-GS5]|nr:hypothetical protein [Streptosporangiaceae bacterium NEAU-GS5]
MPNRAVRRRPYRKRGQNWYPAARSLQLGSITGSGGLELGGTATTRFTHAGGSVISDVILEIDWDDDGDFDEPEEDVTSLVLSLETSAGRDWPSLLTGTAGPGKLRATLLNDDDRLSYFQQSSPLNQAPFSLETGVKARLRTAESVVDDPVTLVRDRFRRADNSGLGAEEYGQSWVQPLTHQWAITSEAAVATHLGSTHLAYVDAGVADGYVQATVTPGSLTNRVGLAFRMTADDTYSLLVVDAAAAALQVIDVTAGAETVAAAVPIEVYAGTTIGVLLDGANLTVYLEGVETFTATAINTSATLVGIYADWGTGDTTPAADTFYTWDSLPSAVEGVLWTGDVTDLTPAVEPGPRKSAVLEAEGWLGRMATQTVTPPTSVPGRRTGLLLGEVLAQAGLLHPPLPLSLGDITTGPFAMDATTALEVARRVEETEYGFVRETNEGPIAYDARSARDSVSASAGFSDAVGAQFGMTDVSQSDWRREVFNRIIAGVSPFSLGAEAVLYTDPGPYALSAGQSVTLAASYSGLGVVTRWTGHTRQVSAPQAPAGITTTTGGSGDNGGQEDYTWNVTLPTTAAGDLLLLIAQTDGATWDGDEPSGWTALITQPGAQYPLVLMRIAAGNESGVNVAIDGNGTVGVPSAMFWALYRITDWFDDLEGGVEFVGTVFGSNRNPNPPAITPSWGAIPSLFIAGAGYGVYSTGSAITATPPTGYGGQTFSSTGPFENLAAWMSTAYRIATVASEDPGTFGGSSNVAQGWAAWTLAVRGSNAPIPVEGDTPAGTNAAFTVPYDTGVGGAVQQVTDIQVTGIPLVPGDTVSVQADDTTSQDRHKAIKTYRNPADLFASPTAALTYAQLVLDTHATDRPIMAMSFVANKTAAHRMQAVRRRIGDKIYLVADNNSGLGIDQEFFIESITHRFSAGARAWEVTWQLSPA